MLELNAKTTALVVIDLQKASYLLPEVHILPMRWLIAPGSWRRNFAPAVSPCFWCALAGLPITPKH